MEKDGEDSGFEYSFVDFVIKWYTGQIHVKVADLIQWALDTVQYRHPAAKKFFIQSDNASGFGTQELIQLIFNMNARLDVEKYLVEQMDIHNSIDRKNTIRYSLFISQ